MSDATDLKGTVRALLRDAVEAELGAGQLEPAVVLPEPCFYCGHTAASLAKLRRDERGECFYC